MSGAASEEFSGGCHCGSVRYRATATPRGVHFCHCRMCQRAVGNLFGAFAAVERDRLEWTRGKPAIFQSSSAAERGFCRDCGTPLFFRYIVATKYNLTAGSFDHPEHLMPEAHEGIESHVPWHVIGDDLPRFSTDTHDPRLVDVQVYQEPIDA